MNYEYKNTFRDISQHILSSAVLAAAVCFISSDLSYGLIFLLGGIFIDLDHLFDYFSYKDKFSLRDFFGNVYLDSGRVYVLLHSWELNALILAAALVFKSYGLFVLFLALSLHLAIDNAQRKNPMFYLLSYRIAKEFSVDTLLPERKDNPRQ
mgnify:CR=1 FL=1